MSNMLSAPVQGLRPFQQPPSLLRRPINAPMPVAPAGGPPAMLATPNPSAAPAQPYGGPAPAHDPIMEAIRNLSMGQGMSRAAGARLAAQNASPNDPSLAAYGGLMGQLTGQSDASNQSQTAGLSWMQHMQEQAWQEQMLRLKAKLEREGQPNPLMGLLGTAAGSFLGPAGTALGNRVFK